MAISMTGYGQYRCESNGTIISVEVRTLNSKFLDVNLKLPVLLQSRELDIRNVVSAGLLRGKVSLVAEFKNKGDSQPLSINKEAFRSIYTQFNALADEVDAAKGELFRLTLEQPEVVESQEEELLSEQWEMFLKCLHKSIEACARSREKEGEQIGTSVRSYGDQLGRLLAEIKDLEQERIEATKTRLKAKIEEVSGTIDFDPNRFEQELLYYLERFDIAEETTRLDSHLKYFQETINRRGEIGKKLGFIAQEIGREINTIGSKANDHTIQHLVVQMKEELEKIKEQALNIL
jgi:uncharacterized protein (TIGR00255 family)